MDDPDAMKISDMLFSLECDQNVQAPTHIHWHTLDLVLTRSSEAIIVEQRHAHDPIMFDHTPLTFCLITKKPPPEKKLVSLRK